MTGFSIVLGAGPLGRAIAAQLAAEGEAVRLATRDGRAVGPGIVPVRADLADRAVLVDACRGAATIYQCAAPPYHRWVDEFPHLQENVIAAAAATGATIAAIENLYGYGVAGTLSESLPQIAETRKGKVRAQMSGRLMQAHAGREARAVAGRASDYFGPEVSVSALGDRYWPAMLKGGAIDWFGDPDARHSFSYLPDVARGLVALARDEGAWGRAWHLPAMPAISVRNLSAQVARRLHRDPPKIRRAPAFILRLVGLVNKAAGEVVEMGYMFNNDFILDHRDFDARFGPMERTWDEAIDATVDWWRERMGKKAAA